jgi:hypothetical protein
MTINDWTGSKDPAPEYAYYTKYHQNGDNSNETPVFNASQVGNITSSSYTYFGIGNTYNAKALTYNFQNFADVTDFPNEVLMMT